MPVQSMANAMDYYIGLDFGYLTGDFDGDVDTDLYSMQVSGGVYAQNYDFNLVLPVLRLEDDNGFSESGIGDLYIRYGHELIVKQPDGISLDGSLMVKMPTADEAAGLGTGEIDYGIIFNLDKKWPDINGNLHVGYIRVGDSSDINYDDVVLYGVTIYKNFNRIGTYLSFESRTATIHGSDDSLETHIGGFYALSVDNALVINSVLGLNAGSPDFAFNIGVRHWLSR